jgi:hypothetical protein
MVILVLGAVMVMAAAFSGPPAPFAPGAPLPLSGLFGEKPTETPITAAPQAGLAGSRILSLVIMVSLAGTLWFTIRQRVVRAVVAIWLLLMVVVLLAGPAGSPESGAPIAQIPLAATPPPPAIVANPAPAPWVAIAISTGVLLMLALLIVRAWRRRPARPAPPAASPALAELAQEARATIGAIEAGADLRTSIVRCYLEMSRVLSTQRGVVRDAAMTSREFAQRLISLGLHTTHIQALTDLFERYRYSLQVPSASDAADAVQCLAVIAQAQRGEP